MSRSAADRAYSYSLWELNFAPGASPAISVYDLQPLVIVAGKVSRRQAMASSRARQRKIVLEALKRYAARMARRLPDCCV
jgi:hypothetical protein